MNTSNLETTRARIPSDNTGVPFVWIDRFGTVYLRLALAAGFLAAATDRLGIWGPYGTPNVAWGDWGRFVAYTARLNPELPMSMIPALALFVTAAEIVIGVLLLIGWRTRVVAACAGLLLLLFGLGMTIGTGAKSALNASVFAASGGAFLLATAKGFADVRRAAADGEIARTEPAQDR